MSMWHHFTDAADALAAERLSFTADWLGVLANAPKFYIPEIGRLTDPMVAVEGLPRARMPFRSIVTYRRAVSGTARVLTIFVDMRADDLSARNVDGRRVFFAGLSMFRADDYWRCMPPTSFTIVDDGQRAKLCLLDTRELRQFRERIGGELMAGVEQDIAEEMIALGETCMLLNCNNVETVAVPAPKALNKKRIAKGKRPLYEYHVLKVDGEVWDSPAATTREGSGVRSHFRRGHFRRLDESRMAWVRATMVKGSVPGFVDKDYDIKPRALA